MSLTQPTLKFQDSFNVSGISIQTQNKDEFDEKTAKLPKLWQAFYSTNPALNTPVFGVYSNYESDANGLYTVTVGVVSDTELNAIKINAGNYLVFEGKGAMPLAVIEVWKRVWDYFTQDCAHKRCFMTDFEVYNGDEVAIYIGIK